MSELVSRPGARDSGPHQAPGPKTAALTAVVAAGACVLTGVLACAAVAVVGWLAATAGGAPAAVRAGAVAWLVAHKATAGVGGGTIGLAPLGLTLVVVLCLYRAGRFTARVSEADRTGELVTASVVLSAAYGAGAALVALIASDGAVSVSPVSALLGAGTLALLAGGAGVLVESGAAEDIADATPDWLRESVPAALAAALTVLAVAALLLAVSLLGHFSRSTSLLGALDPGPVGALVLFAICLVLLPNAILYAVAFLAGPGFQLGTGTTVAPTGVELGNLPALPLLAAVPADGATPGYLLVLTAVVPVVAGMVAGLVVIRRVAAGPAAETVSWEGLALRAGLAAVLAAGLLLTLMVMAGGPAGPGRMADVGVPSALPAAAVLAVGTALGAAPAALLGGHSAGRLGDAPQTPALPG
jgi:Family of unknown function (DUF6350)